MVNTLPPAGYIREPTARLSENVEVICDWTDCKRSELRRVLYPPVAAARYAFAPVEQVESITLATWLS